MKCSENQLAVLLGQLPIIEIDDHGLGPGYEDYACHYTHLKLITTKERQNHYSLTSIRIVKTGRIDHELDYKGFMVRQSFQATHVVLASEGIFASNPRDQASHLCDNPRCIRVEHLCWENSQKNQSRKNCAGMFQCYCCNTLHDCREHEPKCKLVKKRK